MNGSTNHEETLFEQALRLQTPAEQQSYVRKSCANDAPMLDRLLGLLAAHDRAGMFLEHQEPDPVLIKTPLQAQNEVRTIFVSIPPAEGLGTVIGRYKLLQEIGAGGMGVVYMAEQEEPVRRRVAHKINKLGLDTKSVIARFEAERQALAMMDHPNIAKVLDGGATDSGRPYFVMELVRGIKITEYCDEAKLSTRDRLDLFIKVCQAVQHAHQKGIIHRDIKPSNILVTINDGVAVPKVIDFGIAKATEGRLTDKTLFTQFEAFIGTPAYVSPEQAVMTSLDIDTRSDIYSLGVLLYELLAGSTPFDAKELMASGIDAMRMTIREKEPMRPSTRLATLPGDDLTTTAKRRSVETSKLMHQLKGDLDWIVMKCLEKDRSRRYETATGLATDLKRHLNNEPVVARPPSAIYKFQKAFRRNKLLVSAGVAVALSLSVGIGLSIDQAARARRERDKAVEAEKRESSQRKTAEEAQADAARQRDLARKSLYESLLREARSIRKARQLGYRSEVFSRLKQATDIGTTNVAASALRREAASCFGDSIGLPPIDIPIKEGVWSGALTPDGALAALAPEDSRIVSLRETSSGHEIAALDVGGPAISLTFDSKGSALFVAVSGSRIDFGERPKYLHLEKWSLSGNGSWRRDWSHSPSGVIRVAALDDQVVGIEIVPEDSFIAIQNLDRNDEIARVPVSGELARFPILALSPDGHQLAFFDRQDKNSLDWQLETWDLVTRKQLASLPSRLGRGIGLSFGPNGRTLAATYCNNLVGYETSQFSRTLSMLGSFEGTLGAAIGGSAGLLAAPLDQEFAVRLIELQSGRELAFLDVPGIPHAEFFSRDGSTLLLTHEHGGRIVRLQAEQEKIRLAGHEGGVPTVEFSPDGKQLASIGKDQTLRLWDVTKSGESRVLAQLPDQGQTLTFTPDGLSLVCGYYNITDLSIWSVGTGKQIGRVSSVTNEGTTWSCVISPDGRYLATVGSGLRVWSLGELLLPTAGGPGALLFSETNGISGVVFDPTSRQLAFQDLTSTQPFIPAGIATRELVPQAVSRMIATNSHVNLVQGLGYLPRNGALVYVAQDCQINFVEPSTGRVLRTIRPSATNDNPKSTAKNLRISPDESRLAVANDSGLGVELWNPATGKLIYNLPDEPGTIWWLAWSPDSQRLAISRANGEITIWNLKQIEDQLSQIGLAP